MQRTNSCAHLLDLWQDDIPEWNPARFSRRSLARVSEGENYQSADVFLAEQAAIADASRPIRWLRPSDGDADRLIEVARVDENADADPAGLAMIMGSTVPEVGILPDATEMAATALRTLSLPGIAEHRRALMPEIALYGARDAGPARS